MNRIGDGILQVLFVFALVVVAISFYFTRMVGLQAGDGQMKTAIDEYSGYTSVFQFEQEEQKIITRIKVLKADYASDLMVYKREQLELADSQEITELEKREKADILNTLYSDDYFDRKLDLIDEQNKALNTLRQEKCRKYCIYQDLPISFDSSG